MFFCMPCLMHFQADFSKGSSWNLFFFRSVRKRPTSEICNTLRVKTNISQGARLRRRSGEGEEELQKQHKNNVENAKKNAYFSYFFRAGRPCSKNGSIMTSRRLSGTLPGTLWEPPGTPWEAQEAPRATQGDPRSRQERPKSLAQRVQQRLWKPVRRPRAAQRPPGSRFGAISEQFLKDFEAFWLVFSTPRRLILNRSGGMFPICLLDFWNLFAHVFA